jgi:hypothetical protein
MRWQLLKKYFLQAFWGGQGHYVEMKYIPTKVSKMIAMTVRASASMNFFRFSS